MTDQEVHPLHSSTTWADHSTCGPICSPGLHI